MNTIELVRSIVTRVLGERLDFLALYPARVVVQNLNGTLDVQPDDARLPSMQSVPIRYGVPGVTAKVAAGGRVLIGFENGDPSRPVATLWDSASTTIQFHGRLAPIGRVGDRVQVTIPTGSFVTDVTGDVAVTMNVAKTVEGIIAAGAEDLLA